MGVQVIIRKKGDETDIENKSPFLGSDFQYEIANGGIWESHSKFLTDEEIEFLNAKYLDLFDKNQTKTKSPKTLKTILQKVLSYLENEKENLPYEIEIDFEKMRKLKLDTDLYVDGVRCWIQGDSKYYKVKPKFKIVNLPLEKTIEKWIEYNERVEIDNRTYFLKIETRYDRYKKQLADCIKFCEDAIDEEKEIYWLYED